ncbi:MAG: cupin domain-containing protein, partial [Planctomycetota bacterium]
DQSARDFPSRLLGWNGGAVTMERDATHFGFVAEGQATIQWKRCCYTIGAGMYFCLPSGGKLTGEGRGIVMGRVGHTGLFQIGGPIEREGRLDFEDGCRETTLISAIKSGDPEVSLISQEPNHSQPMHWHTTSVYGMVISGSGRCELETGSVPLNSGMLFSIPAGLPHAFHVDANPLVAIGLLVTGRFSDRNVGHPVLRGRNTSTPPCDSTIAEMNAAQIGETSS